MERSTQKDLAELVALAAADHDHGRFAQAIDCYRRILLAMPNWGDAHNNLGCSLQADGQWTEAVASYQRAIAFSPWNAVAHHNLGFILNTNGKLDEAAKLYERAIELNPLYAQAHSNLGNILFARKQIDQAERHYKLALSLDPQYADAHNNFGNLLKSQGKLEQAAHCYRQAVAIKSDYADPCNNLGSVLQDMGRSAEAVDWFVRALALNPDFAEAHCNLGVALMNQQKTDRAISCFNRAIEIRANYPEPFNNMASVLKNSGRLGEAKTACEKALAIEPGFAAAHCNLGSILQDQGLFDAAAAAFRKAISLKPGYPEALYSLASVTRFRPGDPELAALEFLNATIDSVPQTQRPFVHFGLAKALDESKDFDRAFEQFKKGNQIKRRLIHYDEAGTAEYFRQIAEVFDRQMFDRAQPIDDSSDAPIFILGMPRSGSTLIEQILSNHPQIQGAGELDLMSRVANSLPMQPGRSMVYPWSLLNLGTDQFAELGRAYLDGPPALSEGKTQLTDKMPGNFLYIGLIHLMLPNARIIHTMRDPLDTCFSCYSKLFANGMPYSYELGEVGRYYGYYRQLMNHWREILPPGRILDVSYEALIDDLESESRRMIAHCGLPWDSQCLRFQENKRAVSTASNVGVRQPLHSSSVGRWRRYERHLQPLIAALSS